MRWLSCAPLRARISAPSFEYRRLGAAARWFDQAEQQTNGGGLAGTVGAEKTEDRTSGNLYVEIVESTNCLERAGEPRV